MSLGNIPLKEVGRSIQLVGAVYADAENAWALMLPGKPMQQVKSVEWNQLTTEEWTQFLRQTDTVEVEALVQGDDGKVGRAIVRKTERQVSKHISWQVYRRDEYRCRYCGADDVPLTVDHLITWESGGPSIPENLLTSCSPCNNERGELSFANWLSDSYYKKVSAHLPHSVKFANQALVPTLANIPISPLKAKRKRGRQG